MQSELELISSLPKSKEFNNDEKKPHNVSEGKKIIAFVT